MHDIWCPALDLFRLNGDAAIINVNNSTCAFSPLTSNNVCSEKGQFNSLIKQIYLFKLVTIFYILVLLNNQKMETGIDFFI